MIGIVDYDIGNLRSVQKAFQHEGGEAVFVRTPEEIAKCDALVLPGVGAFGDCVRSLAKSGMWDDVVAWAKSEKPFFGICVGFQMLFDSSEEAPGEKGLGIFAGEVRKFSAKHGLKIPQIGWNNVTVRQPDAPLLSGISTAISSISSQLLRHAAGPVDHRARVDLRRHVHRGLDPRQPHRHAISPREKPARRPAHDPQFHRAGRAGLEMSTRYRLLLAVGLMPLAGCASSSAPKTVETAPGPDWTETIGTGTTTEHQSVQTYNRQMLNTEHSQDAYPPDVTTQINQGIP